MKDNHTRRSFLKSGILITGAILVQMPGKSNNLNTIHMQEKPPPLSPDLVRDFVIAGHGNLNKVKEMLEQSPTLVNASWDWGNGDFETAIGGAGHMGNREIAEYLLSRGARIDIFSTAMLGRLDAVKSMLTYYPQLKSSKGPHGLMLLHHAEKGGANSKDVLDYLKEIGAS